MKAGDPKQAVVLSVVAVVIVGVAVFRILPKKGSSIAAVAQAQRETQATVSAAAAISSTQLQGDPFFHPGLRQEKVAPDQPNSPSEPSQGTLPRILPQGVPADWDPATGVRPVPPDGAIDLAPEENTGADQQVQSGHQVVVNAILTVARPQTYISVDGEDGRYGVGDDLRGLGTIVSISSRAVVIKTPAGKVTLIVGEPKKL